MFPEDPDNLDRSLFGSLVFALCVVGLVVVVANWQAERRAERQLDALTRGLMVQAEMRRAEAESESDTLVFDSCYVYGPWPHRPETPSAKSEASAP